MRILTGIVGLAAVLMLSAPHVAQAAPPRVAGPSCRGLAAQVGPGNVWRTTYRGYRHQLFGPPRSYYASPCFRTEAACKAWLYWAQTDWPRMNSFTPCRPGY